MPVSNTSTPAQPGSKPDLPRLMTNWVVNSKDLVVKRQIGKGSGGIVYLGRLKETDVAIKEISLVPPNSSSNAGKIMVTGDAAGTLHYNASATIGSLRDNRMWQMEQEVQILSSLRHPNIVMFMGFCLDPPRIITDYCARGSLSEVLGKARLQPNISAQLTWPRRLSMALHIAKGMLQLHANVPAIVHGDLKCANVLVDKYWCCKVADFDLSMVEGIQSHLHKKAATNPVWMAPEVLDGGRPSKASDVYAFALILYQMLVWQEPWHALAHYEIVVAVMARGERPVVPADLFTLPGGTFHAMEQYLGLMRRCWSENPEARPSFTNIIKCLRRLSEECRPGSTNPPHACNVAISPHAHAHQATGVPQTLPVHQKSSQPSHMMKVGEVHLSSPTSARVYSNTKPRSIHDRPPLHPPLGTHRRPATVNGTALPTAEASVSPAPTFVILRRDRSCKYFNYSVDAPAGSAVMHALQSASSVPLQLGAWPHMSAVNVVPRWEHQPRNSNGQPDSSISSVAVLGQASGVAPQQPSLRACQLAHSDVQRPYHLPGMAVAQAAGTCEVPLMALQHLVSQSFSGGCRAKGVDDVISSHVSLPQDCLLPLLDMYAQVRSRSLPQVPRTWVGEL
eukprot:jgi/Botrbrau1/11679/Bobra.0195s0010.1